MADLSWLNILRDLIARYISVKTEPAPAVVVAEARSAILEQLPPQQQQVIADAHDLVRRTFAGTEDRLRNLLSLALQCPALPGQRDDHLALVACRACKRNPPGSPQR